MSEAEFDIDKAGAEFDAGKNVDGKGGQEDGHKDGHEDGHEDGQKSKGGQPGGDAHLSYQEWIDAGNDPDDYVGKNAFQARYDDIQDNKRLRKELKGLKGTVQQTMDTVQEWQAQEHARIRAELEAELHTAKENEDTDAALEAQDRLNEHDNKAPKKGGDRTGQEHPVIQGFREDNPMLDHDSDDFNEEFNSDVEAFYNGLVNQLTNGGRQGLTEGQMKRALKRALKEAQELHEIDDTPAPKGGDDDGEDDGESKRNKRTGTGKAQRRSARKPAEPRAEDFVIENPRNTRQANAATEVRDMIKEKYGDEAAKNFEKGLAR